MLKKCVAILTVMTMLLSILPMTVGAADAPAPRNFFTNVAGENLMVSWHNPKTADSDITDIKLYNTTSGSDVEIEGEWDTAFDAYNKVALSGMTLGETYSFKLVLTYASGDPATAEITEKFAAPEAIEGWTVIPSGSNIVAKASLKEVEGADGSITHALHLQGNQNAVLDNTYLEIMKGDFTPVNGVTYRVRMDLKSDTLDRLFLMTGTGWAYNDVIGARKGDGTDGTDAGSAGMWGHYIDDGDWTTYEKDLQLFHPSVSSVGLNLGAYMNADCYVDNIEVYELDAGGNVVSENLITNGDFEDGFTAEEPTENPAPRNFFINASGGGMVAATISWRNPESGDAAITDIALYNTTSGSDVEIEGDWDTSFDAINKVTLSNLVLNDKYSFKLVLTYESGDPVTAVITEKYERLPQIPGWSVYAGGENIVAKATVKKAEDKNGNLSHMLHLQGNQNAALDNTYLHLIQNNATVKKDVTYRVKMDIKTEYLDRLFVMTGLGYQYNTILLTEFEQWRYQVPKGVWHTYQQDYVIYHDYTLDSNGGIGLNFGGLMNADCYIDNIEVYELDGSGNVVGENLIINGDFESGMLNNVYDKETAVVGYYDADGNHVALDGFRTSDLIPVTAGDEITFAPAVTDQGWHIVEYDAAGNAVGAATTADGLTIAETLSDTASLMTYTVGDGVAAVRMVCDAANADTYLATVNQPFGALDYYKFFDLKVPVLYPDSPINGLSALYCGDSICYGQYDSVQPFAWAGRLEEWYGLNGDNRGLPGWCLSTVRGEEGRIVKQLQAANGGSYDFVILEGGVNDAWGAMDGSAVAPVGSMTDSFDVADYDINTFAGGLEELFYYAKAQFPNAKIGYMSMFYMPRAGVGNVSNMEAYYAEAKKICEKWGVYYLDLYHNDELSADFNVVVDWSNDYLFDPIHPTAMGYDVMTPYIASWLEELALGGGGAENPEPRNFFANYAGDHMSVSWRNPKTGENAITGIKLYNTTSGSDVEIAGNWDTAFDAFNKVSVAGLTAGETYSFKLVTTYASGAPVTLETSEKLAVPEAITGWMAEYSGSGLTAKATVKEVEAADGSETYALHLQGNQNATLANTYISLRQNNAAPKADTYYRIKMDFKAEYLDRLFIMTGAGHAYQTTIGANRYDGTDGTDAGSAGQWGRYIDTGDWVTYQEDLQIYHPEVNTIGINLGANMNADCYIDNIEIYELDGAGGSIVSENLVVNGDFESGMQPEIPSGTAEKNPNPHNFMANHANGDMFVSWYNPSASECASAINGMKLYNITTGTPVEIAGNWDTAFGAYNKVKLTGLTAGTRYTFRLETDYAEGEDIAIETGEKNQAPAEIDSWSMVHAGNDIVAKAYVQSAVTHSGEGALQLQGNQNGVIDNTYITLMQAMQIKPDTAYRVSFWVKADVMDAFIFHRGAGHQWNFNVGTPGSDTQIIIPIGEWTQVTSDTFLYEAGNQGAGGIQNVGFNFGGTMNADNCYIDDMTIYELTGLGGEIVGENLVVNGGFENDVIAADIPDAVENAEASEENGVATLVWDNPAGAAFDHVNIYEKDGDTLYYRKSVYDMESYTTIEGLAQGKTYEYVIAAANIFDKEGEPVIVTVTASLADYQIGDFAKDGNKVSVSIRNNKMGDSFAPCLLVGLYDGNTLKALYKDSETIAQAESYSDPMTELAVTIANPNNYEVRAFLWNDMTVRMPLIPSVAF